MIFPYLGADLPAAHSQKCSPDEQDPYITCPFNMPERVLSRVEDEKAVGCEFQIGPDQIDLFGKGADQDHFMPWHRDPVIWNSRWFRMGRLIPYRNGIRYFKGLVWQRSGMQYSALAQQQVSSHDCGKLIFLCQVFTVVRLLLI